MCAAVSGSRLVVIGAAALAALFVLVAWCAHADAAERLYWDNWLAEPATVSFGDGQAQGGGAVNLGGYPLSSPEGMAYDSAGNRLFVPSTQFASPSSDEITGSHIAAIDLGGGGATNFVAPGAPVQFPLGIAIDPLNRTVYWINRLDEEGRESISWARLDGSAGGTLNTSGAELRGAVRLAIDPQIGRLYWGNAYPDPGAPTTEKPATISWASVEGSGGGNLDISKASPTEVVTGIAVDEASSRVYWLNEEADTISYAALNGGSSGDVAVSSGAEVVQRDPFGLAFEPALGRFLWGNYGLSNHGPEEAFGFLTLSGGAGILTPNVAPVDGAQDPLLIKSPTATAAPAITRAPKAPNQLSCSTGAWAADLPGDSLYQAPRTYAYQWSNKGVAVAGATAPTFNATAKGSYTCAVTASNQAGASAATASTAAAMHPASLKLTLKKKLAKAKPGKQATFKVSVSNKGDLATGKSAKLCLKLSKSLKKSFKAKCAKVNGIKGLGSKVAKLKLKVKPAAETKTYSLKIVAGGVSAKPLKVKLKVLG